jgi:hypothetical protein
MSAVHVSFSRAHMAHTTTHSVQTAVHSVSAGWRKQVTFLTGVSRIMGLTPNITLHQNVETNCGGGGGANEPPVKWVPGLFAEINEWSCTSSPPIRLLGVEGKAKAIPLQAWRDPEGSRRLRLSDFKTFGT